MTTPSSKPVPSKSDKAVANALDAARKKAARKKAKEAREAPATTTPTTTPTMTLAAPKTPPEVLEAQRARRARAKARRAAEEQNKVQDLKRHAKNLKEAEDLIKEAVHRGRFYQEHIAEFNQWGELFAQEGVNMAHYLKGLEAALALMEGLELPPEAAERLQAAIRKIQKEGEALTVRREVIFTLKQKFSQQSELAVSTIAKAEQMLQHLTERGPSEVRPTGGGRVAGEHPGAGVANSRKKVNS